MKSIEGLKTKTDKRDSSDQTCKLLLLFFFSNSCNNEMLYSCIILCAFCLFYFLSCSTFECRRRTVPTNIGCKLWSISSSLFCSGKCDSVRMHIHIIRASRNANIMNFDTHLVSGSYVCYILFYTNNYFSNIWRFTFY